MRNRAELLLSKNEAVARGANEAGVTIAAGYPGTPSSKILESLSQCKNEVYCEWAPSHGSSYRGILDRRQLPSIYKQSHLPFCKSS